MFHRGRTPPYKNLKCLVVTSSGFCCHLRYERTIVAIRCARRKNEKRLTKSISNLELKHQQQNTKGNPRSMSQETRTSNEEPTSSPLNAITSFPATLRQMFTVPEQDVKGTMKLRSHTKAPRRPSGQEIVAQSHLEGRAGEMGFQCPSDCMVVTQESGHTRRHSLKIEAAPRGSRRKQQHLQQKE